MYKVYGLRVSLNFGVRPAAGNFYLQLTIGKMCAFEVFTKKYLRQYSCNGSNFTAKINCTNPKTEIQSETIETKTESSWQ